jgi:hypothetical protein
MLLVHSNIKLLLNLYALQGGSLTPDCHLILRLIIGSVCPESRYLSPFFGWLTLRRLVAHFTPDWWLTMVQISQAIMLLKLILEITHHS